MMNLINKIVKIPIISRIGLRYIDKCPFPSKTNESFREWFSSVFDIERFPLSDIDEMDFKTVIKKGDYYIRYVESFREENGKYFLIMDFDGYATNVKPDDFLNTTDALHKIITEEYDRTINDPVIEYMREEREVD